MYRAVDLAGRAGSTLLQDRSFFGMYRVRSVENNHILLHGTTQHGAQSLDSAHRTDPLSYYHRGSPVSDLFASLAEKPTLRVAVVGLGTGALACYGRPHEQWTFFEIDPMVAAIARTPQWFTYLRDCPPRTEIVIGDARLRIRDATDASFDVIVLDAFSSDAVPSHLMTREAVALYLRKLKPDGLITFHISNRFLDLQPVLAALANDASLAGAAAERVPDAAGFARLHDRSRWVTLARNPAALSVLVMMDGWERLGRTPASRLWTDDYTDVLAAINW
jgi:SAM-dependent methyltransferase